MFEPIAIAEFGISFFSLKKEARALQAGRLNGWLPIAGSGTALLSWLAYHWLAQPNWLTELPASLLDLILLAEAAGIFAITAILVAILWRHRHPPAPGSVAPQTLDDLQTLSPAAFERFVADLFLQKGYQVRVRGKSGDLGVDLELMDDSFRQAIVQCKRYQKTIAPGIVRELYGALVHERVNRAFLVTTADISPAARKWAAGKPITLIDGQTLIEIAASLQERR